MGWFDQFPAGQQRDLEILKMLNNNCRFHHFPEYIYTPWDQNFLNKLRNIPENELMNQGRWLL